MSDHVHWIIEMTINPGALDDFRAVTKEMIDQVQANEPETLAYEWFISSDDSTCHVYERYANSAAVMTHHAWFGANFAERVMALVKPTRVVVYGNPNDEVKTALKDFGAAYMAPIGGFAR